MEVQWNYIILQWYYKMITKNQILSAGKLHLPQWAVNVRYYGNHTDCLIPVMTKSSKENKKLESWGYHSN